ncbi:hypothetical protein BN874_220054 [Candidatus Contendobacter odensis Run_B_J11]|uniref:Uncharacterized protein n=1 Tax=Candidatus Contendobacter odensis Run_B_J11 TaxID=1400861 RepID=A0A7U7GCI0_9GAMM|nr:hypothetical protein BN874_220054 [Candidatus Contendobacter odensis Run_B_J11]
MQINIDCDFFIPAVAYDEHPYKSLEPPDHDG